MTTTIKKNFCKKGMMSTCDQKKDPKEQENCEYFKKNSRLAHCRWLTFKEFCQSVDAQRNTKNI